MQELFSIGKDLETMLHAYEQQTDKDLIDFYRAYWNVSARLSGGTLDQAIRRTPTMAKDLLDFLKPEIDEKIAIATREAAAAAAEAATAAATAAAAAAASAAATAAAKKMGINPDVLLANMAEAGFAVPGVAAVGVQ